MSRKQHVLDSSILIGHWRRRWSRARNEVQSTDVIAGADELIALYQTDAILTPVYLEVISGTSNEKELRLTQVFLDQFTRIDDGRMPPQDWELAIRLAQRIPRSGKPRQMGDCLIRAVARRLRVGVKTLDKTFPV